MVRLAAGARVIWFGSTVPDRNAPPTTTAVATDKNAMRMTIFYLSQSFIRASAAEQ